MLIDSVVGRKVTGKIIGGFDGTVVLGPGDIVALKEGEELTLGLTFGGAVLLQVRLGTWNSSSGISHRHVRLMSPS